MVGFLVTSRHGHQYSSATKNSESRILSPEQPVMLHPNLIHENPFHDANCSPLLFILFFDERAVVFIARGAWTSAASVEWGCILADMGCTWL